jgi:6-phosphogluconolactonase
VADDNVYVSLDANQEIVHFTFDRATRALARQGATRLPRREGVETGMGEGTAALRTTGAPLTSSPDGKFVYAALRLDPCLILSYRVEEGTGSLVEIGRAPIPASTPYITTDRTGRFLLGAAYYGDLVWISRIEADGRVAQAPLQVVEQIRTPHNILLHPNNRIVYVAATGHAEVLIFRFDEETGRMTPAGQGPEDPERNATPRHLAFHPGTGMLYAINESTGTIDCFRADADSGALSRIQRIDPRSEEERESHGLGADLHMSHDGRFLYASERARSTIATFAIDASSGTLALVGKVAAGRIPRSFQIDPSGGFLIAAGQGSSQALVFTIDQASGRLHDPVASEIGPRPTWVEIVSAR